ncbi:ATP binding microtubule motor family protein [Striga hermonthica]|uniref:Kinesin-like protein n=1 Tax=Striga hermonthica TaxID=68872 RepID=A0A9N7P0L0_STRHE|nr:ATP binding microtubule motor family protein [Striga hermonthica]
MELQSPPPCPPTVTIRRNPPRRARPTPKSAIPLREPLSSPSLSRNILSGEASENPKDADASNADPASTTLAENLKVFLRIRPLAVQKTSKNAVETKKAWPKNPKFRVNNCKPKAKKSSESCVQVNEDLRSVTVATPQALQETKRIKSEVYEGFSRVFGSKESQSDVYEQMVEPLVDDFLKGKSGMLAAMGPSGSGKTHTVFGCAREPGMVPLALRRIFSEHKKSGMGSSRAFYLSMFEISSEKGKAERMVDLLHDRGDICMQQSVLKGLQEAVVSDAQQAESLIAHGMLKRATAMTNSNSQSSRSQCIINIRCDSENVSDEVDDKDMSSMLTIVDLAGAEREKKTGNMGARLHESNFINNTSMVFGLCLRSLLEHQKNRNKLLQKHYKNSLLTRYLKDYLEGKKRMMLILTVKPGVEDYLDTSFLLRQASPFAKIKFKSPEEPVTLTSNKRPNQALAPAEHHKKVKLSESAASPVRHFLIIPHALVTSWTDISRKVVKDRLNLNNEDISNETLKEVHVSSDGFVGLGIREESSLGGDFSKVMGEKNREYQILQGLSKAFLSVMRQYKTKLKEVEIENCNLRDRLIDEERRSLGLESKLASEKKRFFDLENKLSELRCQCTCKSVSTLVVSVSSHDAAFNFSQHERAEMPEVNSEVPSCSLKWLNECENEEKMGPSGTDSVVTSASEHYSQQLEDIRERKDEIEEDKGIENFFPVDMCVLSPEFSRSNKSAASLASYEAVDDVSSSSKTSASIDNESEQEAVNTRGDVTNLEQVSGCVSSESCHSTALEYESLRSSRDCEDSKEEPAQLEDGPADGLSLVEDHIASVAVNSHIIISPESPQKDEKWLNNESQEKQANPLVTVPPKEGWDANSTAKFVPKHDSSSNLQQPNKPRRRLLPASSVLLKDISILDIKDENDKPKGGRGRKREPLDEKNKTQGSLSLLNLLTK